MKRVYKKLNKFYNKYNDEELDKKMKALVLQIIVI